MEHFITEIRIEELRHLSDIVISLNTEKRQHLLITGKNGSGKTSLLLALQKYLKAVNDGMLQLLFPRATSQAGMLACAFGDCREGQIPRCSAALQI